MGDVWVMAPRGLSNASRGAEPNSHGLLCRTLSPKDILETDVAPGLSSTLLLRSERFTGLKSC